MQMGLPHQQLQLMSRTKRDIGFCGTEAVFYFAPHHIPDSAKSRQWTTASALTREGSIVDSVSAHFTGQPWQVPHVLARVETEEGIVHAHSFIAGKPLDGILGTISTPLQDQKTRDTLCRLTGRMLFHLHQTPTKPVMSSYPTYLRRLEPSADDLGRYVDWLSHGRCAAGGFADKATCKSLAHILNDGVHYVEKSSKVAFVHGDFYGGNILCQSFRMGVVDFELAGIADVHVDFRGLFPFSLREKQKIAMAYKQAGGVTIDFRKVSYLACLDVVSYFTRVWENNNSSLSSDVVTQGLQQALENQRESLLLHKEARERNIRAPSMS